LIGNDAVDATLRVLGMKLRVSRDAVRDRARDVVFLTVSP